MRTLIVLFYAWLLELYRKPLMPSDRAMALIYLPGFNRIRLYNAKARAFAEFVKAKRKVPAYRAFLKANGFKKVRFNGLTPNMQDVPITDKDNYVKVFSMDERCVHGKMPTKNVIIDESSGSSGTATNWARGKKERKRNARIIQFGVKNLLGREPLFIINAFALGPWATGVNITMGCVTFSKLKSLGPDETKIENTIKQFGNQHHYVIMGYPPFLKLLVDHSDIDWKAFNVSFIFGGESMSEGMRDYLMNKGIKRVYSSLGASDLELNISAENDFTISLRRLLRSNELLRNRITKHTGALPMLFQYNPSDFLIETSDEGELIISIGRPDYIAPKIRYNIHDRGHVLPMKELYAILKELNIDPSTLSKPQTDLPILLHYGRADSTVSFFGANISPTDIQETIYHSPLFSDLVNSFCISINENNEGDKQLVISLELQQNKSEQSLDMTLAQKEFFGQLAMINQDFREAKKMASRDDQTILCFYPFHTGPFEDRDIRIKAKYFQ
ncbi:MAG: phenylacetate--CoA ligase family protein [Flavobacteriales bacterium]